MPSIIINVVIAKTFNANKYAILNFARYDFITFRNMYKAFGHIPLYLLSNVHRVKIRLYVREN